MRIEENNNLLVVFGRQPELGEAELNSWAVARGLRLEIKRLGEVAEVTGLSADFSEELCHELSGIVKVAVVEKVLTTKVDLEAVGTELIKSAHLGASVNFGLSFYGEQKNILGAPAIQRVCLTIKKNLKTDFKHLRWVKSTKGVALTSVVVQSQLLPPKGIELIVWGRGRDILIGKTLAVQEYEAWGERDFGRPVRNAKQGMLPPKLARAMINLLGEKPHGILLDPFCGSGTVLVEAALAGWKDLVAADINPRAERETQKNFEWAVEKLQAKAKLKTFTAPVAKLRNLLPSSSVQAIVTEPFLGKPISRPLIAKQTLTYNFEVLPIYKDLLETAAKVLAVGGRAVVVVPSWKVSNGTWHDLPINRIVWPSSLRQIKIGQTKDLVYVRPDQFVARRLILLEKVST